MTRPALKFVYRNHRGEIEERVVDIFSDDQLVYFAPNRMPEYHPKGGWVITGWCRARSAPRTFELKHIIGPIEEVP